VVTKSIVWRHVDSLDSITEHCSVLGELSDSIL
jgi:hypothetical protein